MSNSPATETEPRPRRLGRLAGLALRAALILACAAYVLWDLDLAALLKAVASYDPLLVAGLTAYQILLLLPPALRLRALAGPGLGLGAACKATLLCLALNNVLPAKLGELAKAVYIKIQTRASMAHGLELVFWERFFDVNAALLIALAATAFLGLPAATLPLAGAVAAGWASLYALRLAPGPVRRLLTLIPNDRLRLGLTELAGLFGQRLRAGFVLRTGLITAGVWGTYAYSYYLALNPMAGLDLGPTQVATAFAAGILGMTLPSSPGGFGVFEAALVAVLGWQGIPKEQALPAALVLHISSMIPSTALGLWVLLRSGISLRSLRGRDRNPQQSVDPASESRQEI